MKSKKKAISKDRTRLLHELEKKIKFKFKDISLLNIALIHKSYTNELKNKSDFTDHNEKLEFFGDSVISMIICEYLIKNYPDMSEGVLAKAKSRVVSDKILTKAAKTIDLGEYLLLGKGELINGGKEKEAILEDAFEALVGACYLDSGLKSTRKLVVDFLSKEIKQVIEHNTTYDYKSQLQEYVQKIYKITPEYIIKKEEGPDHNRTFFIEVCIKDRSYGVASGKSKKEAQQKCAYLAYNKIKKMAK